MSTKLLSLKNLKIARKLNLIMVLPVAALVLLSSLITYQEYHKSSQLNKLEKLVLYSPSLTNLVHELQKERGISAVYIGSSGKNGSADKVDNQYTQTNKFRELFDKATAEFDKAAYGSEFSGHVDRVVTNLDKLDGERSKVGKLDSSVPQMAKYYTGAIASMLGTVKYMALLSDNATILSQVVGYTNFLQAKEYSGQERAMGANGFSKGKFEQKVHQRFVSLIAKQEAVIAIFRQFAKPHQLTLYDQEMQSSDASEVAKMRKIAINSVYDSEYANTINGTDWFSTITRKIDRLKKVENNLSDDLLALSRALAAQSSSKLITLLAGTLFVLFLTIILSIFVSRSITRPTKTITEQMKLLAENDLSVEVAGIDRGDEIGAMAGAVQIFKDNALRTQQLEADQAAQKQREDASNAEQAEVDKAKAAERQFVADAFDKAMTAIATKNLGYRISEDFPESDQQLKDNFNNAIGELASTIDQVGIASAQILSGANEIHTAADNLAKRTEQQ
ncbi:MAG: methyl-accepting chemotaxis protein, partial [Hyphomicrobiales bacterium]|nr:methyl-accepting chemotaxis protein [Hyphomicrobiales bacterium]